MAKFERVLYEARGQDWPDVNKISAFRNGLNTTLRNRLAQQLNLPRRYSDFVRIVQQLAGRSSNTASGPALYNPSAPSVLYNTNNHQHGEPMDVNAVTIGAINTTAAPRARSVSPELRQQFRADDCKLRPYINSTSKVTIAAINNDDYKEDELDSDNPDHPDAW
ncbi:hypothetical protein ACEPPN_000933 [Leptodophora sp. 'Broadleaf-Isolate-01']